MSTTQETPMLEAISIYLTFATIACLIAMFRLSGK
jgi:hypothetical protein